MRKIYFTALFIYTTMIGCKSSHEIVRVIPDNHWHNVISVQADTCITVEVTKTSKTKKQKGEVDNTDVHTELRLIRSVPFQNLSTLPDTLPHGTDANTTAQRTTDFGPQDISQDGSKRIVVICAGVQLLSRSNQRNSIFKIKKIK